MAMIEIGDIIELGGAGSRMFWTGNNKLEYSCESRFLVISIQAKKCEGIFSKFEKRYVLKPLNNDICGCNLDKQLVWHAYLTIADENVFINGYQVKIIKTGDNND